MSNSNFNSLSVNTISVGHVYTSTLFAGRLTNNFSIPWSAMEPYGYLHFLYGTWRHDDMIIPRFISSASNIQTSTFESYFLLSDKATISTLRAPIINANTLETLYVNASNTIYAPAAEIDFVKSHVLSTNQFFTSSFTLDKLNAREAQFSTLSVGSLFLSSLRVRGVTFIDTANETNKRMTLSNGNVLINDERTVVMRPDLLATSNVLNLKITNTSNALQSQITALSNTTIGIETNFSTNQIFTSSLNASTISTGFLWANTLSTNQGFFNSLQGSTISTYTSLTGQLTTSSFSGNIADALTLIIQTW